MGLWPEGVVLGIAQPLDWEYIHYITHRTMLGMKKPNFIFLEDVRGGDIAEKREALADAGLREGCTHILFLDSDMVFPPDTLVDLFRLITEHGADIAGGLCCRGYEPFDPVVWAKDSQRTLVPFVDYNLGDIIEVGATGCACLLIKREVFEKLERPWFQISVEKEGGYVIKRGEDIYFTRRATASGFKILVNTAYDIGHLRQWSIDRYTWLVHQLVSLLGGWPQVTNLVRELQEERKGMTDG